MEQNLHIDTLCARAREVTGENVPLVAPIYQTAVWSIDSVETCEAIYGKETPGFVYTRDANPNHRALETVLAGLEQAEECVLFGTGMAALAGSLAALTRSGGRVVASRYLYGVTIALLSGELARFGVSVDWVDVYDLQAVERALSTPADVLLVETVANPLMQVADLPALAGLCRPRETRLVVDSTFTPPPSCRPLALGADLVVHSVTKVLGGHSDITLGAVAGSEYLMEDIRRQARVWGGAANPFESWLALRGVTTLPLRLERSSANAQALAERLEAHPRVRRVFYPGLPSHPQYDAARRVLKLPGHMLAFELEDGPAAQRFIRSLRTVRFAPSLGDVATTLSYPTSTSHRALPREERLALGISEGLIRLSVGIDYVEDVWRDFEAALSREPSS